MVLDETSSYEVKRGMRKNASRSKVNGKESSCLPAVMKVGYSRSMHFIFCGYCAGYRLSTRYL
jgi:hypothetical protein